MQCILCNSESNEKILSGSNRDYYHCSTCQLIFLNQELVLSNEEEKSRYENHINTIEDKGYVDFLNRVIEPASEYINKNMQGLDYGCGPGPTLSKLIEFKGIKCDYYDPYFFPEKELSKQYDFIFATECFEHFYSPQSELESIDKILKPGGILAIMTEFWTDLNKFPDWYYIKDPTHVCFYHADTLKFISEKYGYEIIFCDDKRVVVMRKK